MQLQKALNCITDTDQLCVAINYSGHKNIHVVKVRGQLNYAICVASDWSGLNKK